MTCRKRLEVRTDKLENKIDDIIDLHNSFDNHLSVAKEVAVLQLKLADIEDRSRHNNVGIRVILDTVPAADLEDYFKVYLSSILQDLPASEIVIDRIPRLSKGRNVPQSTPKDDIASIHFYHLKTQILSACISQRSVQDMYKAIQLFPDLFVFTMNKR
ncbi:Hypothetical predicted protein [Pelobates cultripes]|uniref:Uncharacterized protein n=1 Tax=Pelobates cultripes TaxID=61616 RepID=A0AAD1R0H1_PELCU|nr:Hypothetical predicted protein [Pelobates cultripes]